MNRPTTTPDIAGAYPDDDTPSEDALLLISGFLTQHPEAADGPGDNNEGDNNTDTTANDINQGGAS